MPPDPAIVTEYALPTVAAARELVVIVGVAGTVSVSDPAFVASAMEVAVTVMVCTELVAAGAVYVAEEVVLFDSAPPPLTAQETPPAFLSFATLAVKFTESVPSTVVDAAVTVTLNGADPPPHPAS